MMSTPSVFRCFQSLLTFIFVSICLFFLSILTYMTLRKHLMPVSHLVLPVAFGFPRDHSMTSPSYLVSYTNLTDPMLETTPLDIYHYSYRIELVCHSPRSYRNRQLGSFFVQLILTSTAKQRILEHSRVILFPYQSQIIRWIRTCLFLPLAIFYRDYDHWHLEQILVERLITHEPAKRFLELIQLNIVPSSFQLDRCSLHFHVLNLTGLVYSFQNYPLLTGVLSICVLFSIYISFYLIITGVTMLNQMTKKEKLV